MEQEGFLLTFSPPSSQNKPGRKWQTLLVFWNLYFKALIKPLTWDVQDGNTLPLKVLEGKCCTKARKKFGGNFMEICYKGSLEIPVAWLYPVYLFYRHLCRIRICSQWSRQTLTLLVSSMQTPHLGSICWIKWKCRVRVTWSARLQPSMNHWVVWN